MPKRVGDAWGSIRGIIRETLSFSQIKDLVGEAGLPIHRLAHLQQKSKGGASKGQLMDGIDGLFNALDEDGRDRLVAACVEGLLKRDNSLLEELRTTLGRVGWGVTTQGVYPLRLQIELETFSLDDRLQDGIGKTLRRYRDGDFDGAVTAICGLVDSITEKVYSQKSIGDHRTASYQERVSKAFKALESEFQAPLSSLSAEETKRIWNNHYGSVNQAAYVLSAFRREFSDVHGVQSAAPELVQRAIDCAVFIVRSIGGMI
jgi:hypothetical protein